MVEASSRLDISREALEKIKSVLLIPTFEISKNWREKSEEQGSVANTTKHNRSEKRLAF